MSATRIQQPQECRPDRGVVYYICDADLCVRQFSPAARLLVPLDTPTDMQFCQLTDVLALTLSRIQQKRLQVAVEQACDNPDFEGLVLFSHRAHRPESVSISPLVGQSRALVLVSPAPAEQECIDSMTGLIDRATMMALIQASRAQGEVEAHLVLLDIDRLKIINDYLGYEVGDTVIRNLAGALDEALDDRVVLSRWSGHEFMLLVPAGFAVEQVLHDVRTAVNAVHLDQPRQVTADSAITVSIGYGQIDVSDQDHPNRPLRDALSAVNAALFEAKRCGRDRAVSARRLTTPSVYTTGGALDRAIKEDRIRAAVQPIIDLRDGSVFADEALARMITPQGDVIPAGLFIEAAARLQMAHRIDHAIIKQAIDHCVQDTSTARKHFVNVSGDFLRHPELIEDILNYAQQACQICYPDQAPSTVFDKPLVIEMTERELVDDTSEAVQALQPLLDFGLTLALDDFGSGYSSYRYLLDMPFTYLKIEGMLVRHVKDSPRAAKIVQHIQSMAEDMGLYTVAEFVGDAKTAELIREMGIDYAQGFYYGYPELINPL